MLVSLASIVERGCALKILSFAWSEENCTETSFIQFYGTKTVQENPKVVVFIGNFW